MPDAEIENIPSDVSDLLDEIDRLRTELESLRAEHEECLHRARHYIRGRCRYCGGGYATRPHRMHCQLYVGPLEHRWVHKDENDTFGGIDHSCICGGWFRAGGAASPGEEPICPKSSETYRGIPPTSSPLEPGSQAQALHSPASIPPSGRKH